MDRHRHCHALGDLRDAVGRELVLGLLANVDVACKLRSAAAVDDVLRNLGITDYGYVELAGTDGRTVSSKSLVD